jgi:hypothetical protein
MLEFLVHERMPVDSFQLARCQEQKEGNIGFALLGKLVEQGEGEQVSGIQP